MHTFIKDQMIYRADVAYRVVRPLNDAEVQLEELSTGKFVNEKALDLLAESVALNLDKGSPLGLAFNRRALQRLAGPAQAAGLLRALQALAQRLEQAEAILGQARLPEL